MSTETLQWRSVATDPPDDEETVLGAWGEEIEPQALWKAGDAWHLCHSGEECETAPIWWATWPAGPK
jgi:hypothetical protein